MGNAWGVHKLPMRSYIQGYPKEYMLSELYAIASPSTGVSYKTVEYRIMKFSPYGSPMHLFFLPGISFIQKF